MRQTWLRTGLMSSLPNLIRHYLDEFLMLRCFIFLATLVIFWDSVIAFNKTCRLLDNIYNNPRFIKRQHIAVGFSYLIQLRSGS